MGLEYSLYLRSEKSLQELTENYLLLENIHLEKNIKDNLIEIDSIYEILGFIIYLYSGIDKYFSYEIDKKMIENRWHGKYNCLSFEFNKSFDNSIAKTNMINIVIKVLEETTSDVLLLFNSDVLILERKDSKLYLNDKIGFWNEKSLSDKMTLYKRSR